jgi:hypothetical protein
LRISAVWGNWVVIWVVTWLETKLGFRDWLFLGGIKKIAGLAARVVKVEPVMGTP